MPVKIFRINVFRGRYFGRKMPTRGFHLIAIVHFLPFWMFSFSIYGGDTPTFYPFMTGCTEGTRRTDTPTPSPDKTVRLKRATAIIHRCKAFSPVERTSSFDRPVSASSVYLMADETRLSTDAQPRQYWTLAIPQPRTSMKNIYVL